MAQPIFYRKTLYVAAKVDSEGPRLEFHAAGEELDRASVEILIKQLEQWARDIKLIGICAECNVKAPLHRIGCRQAPMTY